MSNHPTDGLGPEALANICRRHEMYMRAKLPLCAVEIADATSYLSLFKPVMGCGGQEIPFPAGSTAGSQKRKTTAEYIKTGYIAGIIGPAHAVSFYELMTDRTQGMRFHVPTLSSILRPIHDQLMVEMRTKKFSVPQIATIFGVCTRTVQRACRRGSKP